MNSVSTLSIAIASSNVPVVVGIAGLAADAPQAFAAILAPFDAAIKVAPVRQSPAVPGNVLPPADRDGGVPTGTFVPIPVATAAIDPNHAPRALAPSTDAPAAADDPHRETDNVSSAEGKAHAEDRHRDHDADDGAYVWCAVALPTQRAIVFNSSDEPIAKVSSPPAQARNLAIVPPALIPGDPASPWRLAPTIEQTVVPGIDKIAETKSGPRLAPSPIGRPVEPRRSLFAVEASTGDTIDLPLPRSIGSTPPPRSPTSATATAPSPVAVTAPVSRLVRSIANASPSVVAFPEPQPTLRPAVPQVVDFAILSGASAHDARDQPSLPVVAPIRFISPQPQSQPVDAPAKPQDTSRNVASAIERVPSSSIARPILPEPGAHAIESPASPNTVATTEGRTLPTTPYPVVVVASTASASPAITTNTVAPQPHVQIDARGVGNIFAKTPIDAATPRPIEVLAPTDPRAVPPIVAPVIASVAVAPTVSANPALATDTVAPQSLVRVDARAGASVLASTSIDAVTPRPIEIQAPTDPRTAPTTLATAVVSVAVAPALPKRARIDVAGTTDTAFASIAQPQATAAITIAPNASLDMGRHGWPQAMIDRIEALRDAADAVDTSIRIVPDKLGTIDVSVRRDGDVTHVHFAAEQAHTRTILADAQPRLAELADSRGLKLGQSSIDGGAGQEHQQHNRTPHPASVPAAPVRARRDAAATDHRIA